MYVDLTKSRNPALQGVKSRDGKVSAWCTQEKLCGMQYPALQPRNPSRLAEYARARVADMPKAAQPRMQALSVSDSRSEHTGPVIDFLACTICKRTVINGVLVRMAE